MAAAITAVVTLSSFSGVMAAQDTGKGCINDVLLEYLGTYSGEDGDTQGLEEQLFENQGSLVSAFVQNLKDSGYLDQYCTENKRG
jgi:hypothetical protein